MDTWDHSSIRFAGTGSVSGRQGKLFCTRDQARYTDDGTIVFIGQVGFDIKLRGQRVDLTAVEDIMQLHIPNGLEIVADIIHITVGEKVADREMLVCFVSQTSFSQMSPQKNIHESLRALVGDLIPRLEPAMPAYLHPEAFITLHSMPKTSSSKTDRRRLKEAGKKLRLRDLTWMSKEMAESAHTPPST
jgi:acyl-coenzyme A synthetase/AMP-(fatty) acid ligase